MDIVEEMRGFEIDHEPEGWPAIRMRQISALCDEIDRLRAAIQAVLPDDPENYDERDQLLADALATPNA